MSPSGTRTPRRSGDIQDDQDPTRTKYRYVSKYYDTDTHGVSIEINVANPEVEESGVSQSIAQLAASGEVGDMDTVELGWRVSRWEAGPRLFTYVNKDNYATHGQPGGDCYNCNFIPLPGADYVPGQALVPSSISTETLQFGVRLIDDNWWVWVGDQWIGYLDGDFWPGTTEYSNSHVFYGEVYDDGEGTTDMGNGRWGHELNSSVMMNPTASYFKNGGWVTVDEPIDPTRGSPLWSSVASRYDGYEAYGARSRSWKFGGPGTG
ncbi:MAG TPA: neprosin family prolyl endopeptidase [Solirubrobacterales bacterium]|nr:neprosin family prolyl endopeptidase [Solirubrobacterales bacterium]